ncbi:hypothetical protein SmJEL517_g04583 [Synchytrium microbalum]|uniref:RING-type domain-containing protein n=1 Tax=Synchytrium microbalum TaxID=1806994 RepID=A0A507BXY4_9FUNG|nr:uncharacterized protein SmJEL517_g04583 [Synchytrium microbalum]TPX32292.1 hypothetical protein SmJEL517_g04583 [Synchytrium microbalum]
MEFDETDPLSSEHSPLASSSSTIMYLVSKLLPPPINRNPVSLVRWADGITLRLAVLVLLVIILPNVQATSRAVKRDLPSAATNGGGSAIELDLVPVGSINSTFNGFSGYAVSGAFGGQIRSTSSLFSPVIRISTDACTPFNVTFPNISNTFQTQIYTSNHNSSAIPWTIMIQRGNCSFDTKCYNAQLAGASIAIVYNDNVTTPDGYIIMTSSTLGSSVTIPSMFLRNVDAMTLFHSINVNIAAANNTNTTDTIPLLALTNITDTGSPQGTPPPSINPFSSYIPIIIAIVLLGVMLVAVYVYRKTHGVPIIMNYELTPRPPKPDTLTSVNFPTRTITSADVAVMAASGAGSVGLPSDCCSVCLDEFVIGSTIRSLPCSHVFHCTCIDPWLLQHNRLCPVCKQDVLGSSHITPVPSVPASPILNTNSNVITITSSLPTINESNAVASNPPPPYSPYDTSMPSSNGIYETRNSSMQSDVDLLRRGSP